MTLRRVAGETGAHAVVFRVECDSAFIGSLCRLNLSLCVEAKRKGKLRVEESALNHRLVRKTLGARRHVMSVAVPGD